MFDGENGWAISSAEDVEDLGRRDELEANALFDLLERQIVPLFYEPLGGPGAPPLGAQGQGVAGDARPAGHGVAHGGATTSSSCTSRPPPGPTVLAADGDARARAWRRGRRGWRRRGTACTSSGSTPTPTRRRARAATRAVEARRWRWATLSPDDVDVQLLHGPVGQGEELGDRTAVSMRRDRRRRRRPRCATGASFVPAGRPLRLHGAGRAPPPRPRRPRRARPASAVGVSPSTRGHRGIQDAGSRTAVGRHGLGCGRRRAVRTRTCRRRGDGCGHVECAAARSRLAAAERSRTMTSRQAWRPTAARRQSRRHHPACRREHGADVRRGRSSPETSS